MAQHYSTSRGNLAQMRHGLGRSEPEIWAYSRFDRRGSSILDIFNESPSPKPPSSPRRPNRYQKFQDAEDGENADNKPNEKKEFTQPKNSEQMKKVLAEHSELNQSGSDRSSFTASEEKPSTFERGIFPNASSSATHTPNNDDKQTPNSPRKGSKFSVVMQNPWRQKNKRRRSGVQMTMGVSTDETQESPDNEGTEEQSRGSPSNGDRSSLLLSSQNPTKDFYTSHEQLFEQQSERKRRFWEFMKSREQLIHYDVFISYNHDSKPFAMNLYKTLKHTFKYSVFIDKQLSTKQKLNSALDEALRNTQLVVCVVTEKYSKSKSCCAEVSLANNLGLPMIPLVIEELPPHKQNPKNFWPPEGEMSLPLAPLLYMDFREHKNDSTIAEEKMKELKKRIDANLSTAV